MTTPPLPGRYGGDEAQPDDGEPFEEKVARLIAQWREQQAEAQKLDAAIENQPEGAGIRSKNGEREMIRPTEVKPREGYRIWLRYSDGATGEIDLSHLAGRGVFKAWNDLACFKTVHIAPAGGIAWGENVELCPDALYMKLTGKSVVEVMPGAQILVENA